MAIEEFTGPYRFLSNFHNCHINYAGRAWKSTEHAYQASKTSSFEWQSKIANASTGEAKRLGRQCPKTDDWEARKMGVMRDLLKIKFANPVLKQLLLDTGDQQLVEGNWHGDSFWGVCDGVGQNHLGKLLMEVRSELQRVS